MSFRLAYYFCAPLAMLSLPNLPTTTSLGTVGKRLIHHGLNTSYYRLFIPYCSLKNIFMRLNEMKAFEFSLSILLSLERLG